jgi:hypothetical protein
MAAVLIGTRASCPRTDATSTSAALERHEILARPALGIPGGEQIADDRHRRRAGIDDRTRSLQCDPTDRDKRQTAS